MTDQMMPRSDGTWPALKTFIHMLDGKGQTGANVLHERQIERRAATLLKRLDELERINEWCLSAPIWKRVAVIAGLAVLQSIGPIWFSLMMLKQ